MKYSAKALREKRAPLAKRITEMAEAVSGADDGKGREFTVEEKANWEAVNKDYNDLSRQIDLAERAEAVEADQSRIVADPAILSNAALPTVAPVRAAGSDGAFQLTEEHRAILFGSWARAQMEMSLTEREEEVCRQARFNPYRGALDFKLYSTQDYRRFQQGYRATHPSLAPQRMGEFRAALSSQTPQTGGYTVVPETLVRSLEINMLAFGGVLQAADTMTTATGERMSWPTADDTSNSGRQVGESPTLTTTAQPSFGKVFWDAYKFTSDAILVPYELLQDSVFDMPNILGAMLGERLGRILASKCTTGTGAATCKGIVTCASAGITAASASAITADEMVRLEHQIDPAYRVGAAYMMHDSTLLALRLLKDGEGRLLWQSGYNSGAPDTFNARPLYISMEMATITNSAKTVLFGQLSKYKVRRVGAVRLYRLEERYRDNDQDGFLAFVRADGNLLDTGTAPVKYLIQAA